MTRVVLLTITLSLILAASNASAGTSFYYQIANWAAQDGSGTTYRANYSSYYDTESCTCTGCSGCTRYKNSSVLSVNLDNMSPWWRVSYNYAFVKKDGTAAYADYDWDAIRMVADYPDTARTWSSPTQTIDWVSTQYPDDRIYRAYRSHATNRHMLARYNRAEMRIDYTYTSGGSRWGREFSLQYVPLG